MRTTFRSIFPLVVVLALAASTFAQDQPQANSKPAQYFFVLLNHPANAPQLSKEEGAKLQEAHMANIQRLLGEHKLLIAGPFLDNTAMRGIFVFRADSAAQVQEWTDSDPAVKAGRLAMEIHGPWRIDPSAILEPGKTEGLDQYTLVLLKGGEKWDPSAPGFMDVMKEHPAFVKKMTEQGKMAVAGPFPFADPGELKGVSIFRVGAEETRKLVQDDPTVKAGLLKAEVHPWATGRGVLAAGVALK